MAESDAKSFSNIPQSMLEEEVALKNRLAFLSNAIANAQDEVEISEIVDYANDGNKSLQIQLKKLKLMYDLIKEDQW